MFPSLWNIFGLTEDASAILLLEMGLLTMLQGCIQESAPKDGMMFVLFQKKLFIIVNAKVKCN